MFISVIDSLETKRQSNSMFYVGEDERTENLSKPSSTQDSPSFFNSLKGGAGSFMKNIKDASAKVMETVSAYVFYNREKKINLQQYYGYMN